MADESDKTALVARYTEYDKKDLEIVVTPECQAEIDKLTAEDPEFGEAIRELFANFRQSHAALRVGHYDSFEDAVEAISGKRPTRVTSEEDDDE